MAYLAKDTQKRVAMAQKTWQEVTGLQGPVGGQGGLGKSDEKSWVSAEWWGLRREKAPVGLTLLAGHGWDAQRPHC